jgi:hypothetical protein
MNKIMASDLDDTLVLWNYVDTGWGGVTVNGFTYNEKLINELLLFQVGGYSIHIVTFRGPTFKHVGEGEETVEKLLQDITDKYGLRFASVVYTNSTCKVPFLKGLRATRFYDDNDSVICNLVNFAPGITPVFIKQKGAKVGNCWLEELIENKMVELFEYE